MNFIQFLMEKPNEKFKPVFIETDEKSPFPNDTITALKKKITSFAKDLEEDWETASDLVNKAFEELQVPIPQAFVKDRWNQYTELLAYGIRQLYDARGFSGTWNKNSINI